MYSFASRHRGFTLIELLVVIAIIGILASVVLASLNDARARGRDAVRKQSLTQMRTALEMYHNANGSYPSTGGAWWAVDPCYGGHPTTGSNGYIPNLAPTYMPMLPTDPDSSGCHGYLYNSTGAGYKLLLHVSPESYPGPSDAFYDPQRPTWAWMVCVGAQCTW